MSMRNNQTIYSILLLASCLLWLTACAPVPGSTNPSIALQDANATQAAANIFLQQTADAGFLQAQAATIAAAQTQDVYDQQATQVASAATAAQAIVNDRATQTQSAAQVYALQTAQAVLTENARATEMKSAEQTATAFPPTQAAMQATSTAMAIQVIEAERRAFWGQFITPLQVILPALFLTALGFLIVLALIHSWPHLMSLLEAAEMRARTIISPDGEIVTFLPRKREVDILQPKRNFGAAMRQGPEGVTVQAAAPDAQMQADTTARQQASILAHHLPAGRASSAQRLMNMPQRPAVKVLQPGESLPSHFLAAPETLDVLDAQWRNVDEDPT